MCQTYQTPVATFCKQPLWKLLFHIFQASAHLKIALFCVIAQHMILDLHIKNVSGINLFDAGSRLDHHRFASAVLHQLHGTIHLIGKIQVLDRL